MRLISGRFKLLFQSLPALKILVIKFGSCERELRRLADETRLEHEGHGVASVDGLKVGAARPLKGFGVGPVPGHAVMQARAARHKPFRLGIVFPPDQPHDFVHEIAMKPRWTKRMLGDHPARRENY